MSPQLTLQTPLQIPPSEIPSYLNQLWSEDKTESSGANTFCLLIWQPAWLEQELVRAGKLKGPIIGTKRSEVIQAARQTVLEEDLPHSTAPFDQVVVNSLAKYPGSNATEDLRGQHIDAAISVLQPRRLITLAPTKQKEDLLETLVAAYCPLPEEGGGSSACGDVIVLRGNQSSLNQGLDIVDNLLPEELPSWLWWNGRVDEAPEFLEKLARSNRRIIIDSSLGEPSQCLNLLNTKISTGQAVNDLNWLRLRNWRETLAMVFDPPERHHSLYNVKSLDIDIQGDHPVQALLLAAWISQRLGWKLQGSELLKNKSIEAKLSRPDGVLVKLRIVPLPLGKPGINPGQVIGLRMICDSKDQLKESICVILGSESAECIRLEAGGMASMELIEKVVPIQNNTVEMDVARLLRTSRGSTSPLLAEATPLAEQLLKMAIP